MSRTCWEEKHLRPRYCSEAQRNAHRGTPSLPRLPWHERHPDSRKRPGGQPYRLCTVPTWASSKASYRVVRLKGSASGSADKLLRHLHTSLPRNLSPPKRGAAIHYYEEACAPSAETPSYRWHSPGLGIKPRNPKKPPHQVRDYPADHKILDDAFASAAAVITCRRMLTADLLDLLRVPTTACSP